MNNAPDLQAKLKRLETALLMSKKTNLRVIEYEAKLRGIDSDTLYGYVVQYRANPNTVSDSVANIAEFIIHYLRNEPRSRWPAESAILFDRFLDKDAK